MSKIRKKAKYVGFYDLPQSSIKRVANLAATNKMDYICDSLIRAGFDVEIISPSWSIDDQKSRYKKSENISVNDNLNVVLSPTWGTKNKVMRNIKIIFSLFWLFCYLILNTKKDENIIVYHVQWLSIPVRFAKFFKKFKLILEVEEIYSDVSSINGTFVRMEKNLIKSATAYLFSTELLAERIAEGKPYEIVYGVYSIEKILSIPPNDGKIHLVYAGVIDSHKKGAFNALESSRHLSEKYILHIIGFGETEKLEKEINHLNEFNQCKVVFDGLKSGQDFIEYCQKCHIGLSTQTMNGIYLQSSFPSKILSYLSMGLRVVSGHVDCVSESEIGELVSYYNEDSPKDIANAIKKIDLQKYYDSRKSLKELDEKFVINLKKMLGES